MQTSTVGVQQDGAALKTQLFSVMLKHSGVLYEDASIQLGCKTAFNGSTGTIQLFVGNKTSEPLNLVKMRVPAFGAQVRIEVRVAWVMTAKSMRVQNMGSVTERGQPVRNGTTDWVWGIMCFVFGTSANANHR